MSTNEAPRAADPLGPTVTDVPDVPVEAADPKIPALTQLNRGEFISAMVHLYRGELGEAAAWRSRIDATTHWALILSATSLTFITSEGGDNRHVMILIVGMFVTFLLMMEARRYRFFDIWRSRARLLEINFYRPILTGIPPELADWAQLLAHDLEWPHMHMPWWEAAGRRLRRSYQWIYAVLLGSWVFVLISHPAPTNVPGRDHRSGCHRTNPGGIHHALYDSVLWWAAGAGRLQPVGQPYDAQAACRASRPPGGRIPGNRLGSGGQRRGSFLYETPRREAGHPRPARPSPQRNCTPVNSAEISHKRAASAALTASGMATWTGQPRIPLSGP